MSRREQHVRELAAELGVDLRLPRGRFKAGVAGRASLWGGSFWDEYGMGERWAIVDGFDGRSQLGYFAALHELGHHAMGHMPGTFREFEAVYEDRKLEAEAEAWKWAFEHSLEPPGPRVRKRMRTEWLASYVRPWREGGPVFAEMSERFGVTEGVYP